MRARFLLFGAIALASVLAACGGGGGGGGTVTPPTKAPTSPPTSGTLSVTFSSPTSMPLPAGYSGSIQVPGGSGTATITFSTTYNSNTSALDTAHLKQKTTADATLRTAESGGTYNGVLYVTITATGGAVTMDGYPGFKISGLSGTYYLAEYTLYWYLVTGPSNISGSSNVLLPTTSPVIALANGQSLYLALYTGGILPSPNPYGCVGVQADEATPSAQVRTQAVGLQPIAGSESATYSGTLTDTIYRSQPCAMPTATSAATVGITASTAATASPAGAYVETDTETDNYALESTQVATQAVVEPVSGTPSTQNELSETSTDLTGDTVATKYNSPGEVYAITSLPYTGSAISNSQPASVVTTLADGSSESRTYVNGSDGAYSETDTIPGVSGHDSITVSASGSGSYLINTSNFVSQGLSTMDVSYSAPSGGEITLTVDLGAAGTSSLTVPSWYSTPLYSDGVTGGSAGTPLPIGCTDSVSYSGPYSPITRTITDIDPGLGTKETETITSYIADNYPSTGDFSGPICVTISDTQNLYYDYLLDTPIIAYFSPTTSPIQTDTIVESYSWSAAPSGGTLTSVRDTAAEQRAAATNFEASVDAHTAGIRFARLTERARRIEAIDQAIATKGLGGIK